MTGYKSLFVNRGFTKRILELHPEESDALLDYLFRHVSENHDLQVRYRWGLNDVAIWDNRSNYHTATFDYGQEKRVGDRVVSVVCFLSWADSYQADGHIRVRDRTLTLRASPDAKTSGCKLKVDDEAITVPYIANI